MRLLVLNSLIMFDIVFIFFLFLVGVTCFVYYMPGNAKKSIVVENGESDLIPPPPPFDCDDSPQERPAFKPCRTAYICIPTVFDKDNRERGPVHDV